MQKNIIFFDIDGTILSLKDYSISESTRDAIKGARENGHLTFINTGRTLSEMDDEIMALGFDGYVCGCGTHILYHSNELVHATLDDITKHLVIQDLRRYELDAVLEGSKAIYFDGPSGNPRLNSVRALYEQKQFHILNWEASELSFDKFCIWINSQESAGKFRRKYEDRFDFIERDSEFWEIIPRGYSKATGIEFLRKHLDIPHENTYALGDSANDYTMLSYVKHSIGMGNSEEMIRSIVSYLTKDVDDHGVAHALRHFHII